MTYRATRAILLIALLAVSLLTGCGTKSASEMDRNSAATKTASSSTTSSTTNSSINSSANSNRNSDLPEAGELIDRIIVAGKQLRSFSVEGDSYQRIVSNASNTNTPTEQIIDTVASSEIIKEPFQMYVKSKAKMGAGDENMEMDMDLEQYVTEDAVFMNFGNWMKMNEELGGKAMPAMREGGNPERQLKPYQSVLEALEVNEEGEHYVIRAKLDNNQLLKFVDGYRNQTNDRGELLMEKNSEVSLRKANIVFIAHKDTYYPVEINLSLDMDITVSGSKVSIESEERSKYSNFNKIKKIEVPQEVLELE